MTTVDRDGCELASTAMMTARPRVPIRDAASLALVRYAPAGPLVLLGLRGRAHVFMPGVPVFPGGAVDRCDLALARDFELSGASGERLKARTPKRFTDRRATALALAAIRELWEETGLMLGRRAAFPQAKGPWRPFAEAGVLPDVDLLVPFARAVTPTGPVRRYDARFFLAPADAIATEAEPPTQELEDLFWHPVERLQELELAPITRHIAEDLENALKGGRGRIVPQRIPYYRKAFSGLERILV